MHGSLYNKYGIKELVDGFNMIQDDALELHLYGHGDAVKYIKEIEKQNKRIKYMGVKSNKEIVDIEKKATLLINPRPTKEEFTLYSFPSKTIEYMLTGTPVLITKLPGIPKEYYDYIYFIEEENEIGIRNSIEKVIKISRVKLKEKGEEARNFILKNKNNEIQGRRIYEFIRNIKE